MDTNNITESFNNVLRRRYLPLRHDTTIFALVQILVEVAFPEQEIRYIQATIKHTNAYRKPRYGMPDFLKERPHTVQGICLANIDRGMALPNCHIKEESTGVFSVVRSSSTQDNCGNPWTVNINEGTCSCPSFQSSHIPCKHMFAIFHHYPSWSWDDLPATLTSSSHLTLDHEASTEVQYKLTSKIYNETGMFHDVAETNASLESPYTPTQPTTPLPIRTSDGRQVYRLQKNIEETLGQCRTLAFLTNNIPALETALSDCKRLMETLASAATSSNGSNGPPTFHAIAQAGVEEFKRTSKALHRVGAKRKRTNCDAQCVKHAKCELTEGSNKQDILATVVKREPGRPKLKRLQRKRPVMPRQVSSAGKLAMLKAAAILRRGEDDYRFLYYYIMHLQLLINTHM